MAFKMSFDKDSLAGGKVLPPGIYTLQLVGFKPTLSKNKDSVNFNPIMKVINHPEFDGQRIFDSMNSKAGFTQWDFCHCFGVDMEDQGNGQYALPGVWDGDAAKFKESDPSTWVYDGPMTGRDGQVELGSSVYEGKESTKIRKYICAVSDCATRFPDNKHSQDLLKRG